MGETARSSWKSQRVRSLTHSMLPVWMRGNSVSLVRMYKCT